MSPHVGQFVDQNSLESISHQLFVTGYTSQNQSMTCIYKSDSIGGIPLRLSFDWVHPNFKRKDLFELVRRNTRKFISKSFNFVLSYIRLIT